MKNFTLLSVVCFVLAFAKADFSQAQQNFKAVATYQSKMIFKKKEGSDKEEDKKEDSMSPEMRAAVDKALETAGQAEFTLKFTKDESIYEKVQELAKPKPTSGISISFSGGGGTYGTTYKNLEKGIFKREDNIMGKEFLIVDDLEKFEWKITGESRMIGNYTAIKAVLIEKPSEDEEAEKEEETDEEETSTGILSVIKVEKKETVAWFTPQIPISNGPGKYHGLPGLILELNEGNTVILCTKVEINPEKFKIDEPKTGKKIKLEKFNKLQKKKQEEQMERFKRGKGSFIRETRG
ncbi:MAG: GLPGLI family protein [Nonlabens sp.]